MTTPLLEAVERLAAAAAVAQVELRAAAVAAVEAGCGEVHTAKAAGVARMTLRKWVAEERHGGNRRR